MITKKQFLSFRSLRVLYQSEDLDLLLNNAYDYVTVIAYQDLGLEKKGFEVVKKKIANIYLDGSEEEILNRFTRTTRQEVAKTHEIPDLEFRIEDSNVEIEYRLYCDFERAQGRKPWKRTSFDNLKHFNAYYKGEMISSVPCYDLFPYLQVRAMFSKRLTDDNQELRKIIGYATRRLIYEICRYAKKKNYAFLGLGAVNYSTTQKANVAQFKMFFGSRVEDEYTYTYASRRFRLLNRIRNLLRL